jgi:hypothetical protein
LPFNNAQQRWKYGRFVDGINTLIYDTCIGDFGSCFPEAATASLSFLSDVSK